MKKTDVPQTSPEQPRMPGNVVKKAIIPTFCFAVLSTAAYQEAVLAEKANPGHSYVKYVDITSGSLNLRKSATSGSAVISSLKKGTAVTVYSEAKGWAKVKASGKIGFVSASFLSSKNSDGFAKQSTSQTVTKYVDVASGALNLRKSASTKSSVIGSLKKGTAVTVYSEAKGWAKVKAGRKIGYVSTNFLASKNSDSNSGSDGFTKQSTSQPVTKYVNVASGSLNMRNGASTSASIIVKLAKGTPVKVYSSSGGWSKIEVYGKKGYVSSAFLGDKSQGTNNGSSMSTPKIIIKYVNINASSRLNVRKSTSTSSDIITKLINGTEVKVISESKGWAKIEVNGKQGFVSSEFLVSKISSPKPQPPKKEEQKKAAKYVNVKLGSSLNMRKSASTKASVLIKLARGVKVAVYSEANGWAKIEAYGKTGYVSSDFLTTTKPVAGSNTESEKKPSSDLNNGSGANTAPGSNTGSGSDSSANNGSQQNKPVAVEKYVNVLYGSSLKMRATASTSAAVITKLARGTLVTVLSEENGWAKVTANGKTGFVSSQYLSDTAPFNPNTTGPSIEKVYESYNIGLADMVRIEMASSPQTDKKYDTYIRADALTLSSPTSGTVNGASWNVRGGASTDYWNVGQVKDKDTLQILGTIKGKDGFDWYKVAYNKTWVNASPEDVSYYVNPNNFLGSTSNSLQFLKLSLTAELDAKEVNDRVLSGKGILNGLASTFIKAGEKYGVNEMYLIAHALLETSNGRSDLANGVQVNGKTVYNMYGIGAIDADAINGGAQFAYNAGWFTPEDAIIGGAQFIANGYINAGQDTLYKMRWNPRAAAANGKATHQYATDIGWAAKQVKQMYNLYSLIDSYKLVLEIPQYK
ncbi:SH3 domain-containing protein [Neobacillus kokaensis]|uniref:Beta-N-acetylglucosaminidase n=1 Tax=Neobacillus kokaensis TaxID=2759023 RepID=A0ABQ3N6F8_9BACI|nr:SH3 domain-containing protein [Neobacillus kokaensis]GHH98110.1 beta-N-acetylglucosaminidase [Neobacillus kokaensis]